MKAAALFLTLLTGMAGSVLLHAEVLPPHAWATTASYGHMVFKMVPGSRDAATPRPHRASASLMGWDGGFEELWSAEGWYAREGFLSENGRYFARIGPGAADAPGEAEALITFYDRGRLLRQHSLKDLVRDAALAEPDRWRPKSQMTRNGFNARSFHLVVAGGTVLIFDPVTGRQVDTSLDMSPQSLFELDSGRRNDLRSKGEEMYAASGFKKAYDERFEAWEVEADDRFKTADVWFEGPEWRVVFKPKKQPGRGFFVEIKAVFPWDGTGSIRNSVAADEIEAAVQAALAHPLIVELNKEDKIHKFELHITGDRLHANTPDCRRPSGC